MDDTSLNETFVSKEDFGKLSSTADQMSSMLQTLLDKFSSSELSRAKLASEVNVGFDNLDEEEAGLALDNSGVDDDMTDSNSPAKLFYQTPANINKKDRGVKLAKRQSTIIDSPNKLEFTEKPLVYTSQLPDHSHIRLTSVKLMPAFLFFEEAEKWMQKYHHTLKFTQHLSDPVLHLLRDELHREYAYGRSMVPSIYNLSNSKIKQMIQQIVQPVNRVDFIQHLKQYATFTILESPCMIKCKVQNSIQLRSF
jgi:hypothetical protein